MTSLTYNVEKHQYLWGGKEVPHVTGVLNRLDDFSMVPAQVLEHARAIGTEVHLATAQIDRGEQYSYTDASLPYINAYKKFLLETRFQPTLVETPMYHEVHKYAGTVDRVGSFIQGKGGGQKYKPLYARTKECVIDLKTGSTLTRSVGPQIAAYEQLVVNHHGYLHLRRYALHLKNDGTYALKEYADKRDFIVFLSCLNLWRFENE